jgi:hypothetical protein
MIPRRAARATRGLEKGDSCEGSKSLAIVHTVVHTVPAHPPIGHRKAAKGVAGTGQCFWAVALVRKTLRSTNEAVFRRWSPTAAGGEETCVVKVLIIDDEPDVLLLCRVNFEFAGHEVFEAGASPRKRNPTWSSST